MERRNGHILSPGAQPQSDSHDHRPAVTGYRNPSRNQEHQHLVDERPTRFENLDGEISDDAKRTATPTRPSPAARTAQKQVKRGNIFSAARDKMQRHTGQVKPDQSSTSPSGKPAKAVDRDRKKYWRNLRRRSDEDFSQSSDNEEGSIPCRASPAKWPSKGDRWIGSDNDGVSRQNSREKADNGTNSNAQSSSISPMSGPSSSTTDWEDRFVVNMPSAKEPNPPTMTARQITEFQKSIENVYREGETMLDPEALPSPRNTPELESSLKRQPHQRPSTPKRKGLRAVHAAEANKNLSASPPSRYYSPEEVGDPGCSTIREESPSRPKRDAQEVNLDGSFLGCKEVNGPGDKNPDEILLFSPIEDHTNAIDVSPSQKTTDGTKTSPDPDEKTAVKEGCSVTSQNLRRAPCLRSSPKMIRCKIKYRQPQTTPLSSQVPGKENTPPGCGLPSNHENQENCPKDDDVFIITPTITRTMVTIKETDGNTRKQTGIKSPRCRSPGKVTPGRGVRPQTNSTPSESQPGIQNSQTKSNAPYSASSKTGPIGSVPVAKTRAIPDRARPRNTRGYIPMPGMVRSSTENFAGDTQNDFKRSDVPAVSGKGQDVGFGRSASASPQFAKCPDLSPVASNTSRSDQPGEDALRTGKCVEIAELDGHQVNNYKPKDFHSKVTDVTADFPIIEERPDTDGMSSLTLSLVFSIFALAIAQAQRLYSRYMANCRIKAVFMGILAVTENCCQLLRRMFIAFSIYKTTGSWPKPKDNDVGRFLAGVVLGLANFVALAFFVMVVGRLAWYVVLIGSWVVWFAKPFGWIFSIVGRLVLA